MGYKSNSGYHGDKLNRKTPEHDEMTMFVHDNIPYFNMEVISQILSEEQDLIWEKTTNESTNALLEEPIKFKKNNYSKEEIIGYIDLTSIFTIENVKKRHFPEWISSDDGVSVPIRYEIKPIIHSVGDVIRQIKYYQQYDEFEEKSIYVVITKSKGYEKYFRNQGIILLNYDEFKPFVEKINLEKEQERITNGENPKEIKKKPKYF